jgi:hypothetical protein
VSGFPEKRRKTVQKVKPGDHLLCHLAAKHRLCTFNPMTEPKIQELFANVGVLLSDGELSSCGVGLRSSLCQHLDDTATRVNGANQHCHVVCNVSFGASEFC